VSCVYQHTLDAIKNIDGSLNLPTLTLATYSLTPTDTAIGTPAGDQVNYDINTKTDQSRVYGLLLIYYQPHFPVYF